MRADLFFSWQALKTYINVGLNISADQVKKKKKKKDIPKVTSGFITT